MIASSKTDGISISAKKDSRYLYDYVLVTINGINYNGRNNISLLVPYIE